MPLFEYRCRECGRRFEEFVLSVPPDHRRQTHGSRERRYSGATPRCPGCASGKLEKLLSVFAVGAGGGGATASEAPAGCGSCGDPRGPGSCAEN